MRYTTHIHFVKGKGWVADTPAGDTTYAFIGGPDQSYEKVKLLRDILKNSPTQDQAELDLTGQIDDIFSTNSRPTDEVLNDLFRMSDSLKFGDDAEIFDVLAEGDVLFDELLEVGEFLGFVV
ncbi:MAG TPA: hypothetical protein VK195_02040 [Burkholderiaceae bacterium]|nr:hypothetical protein [Burkholderiaceae bacterium]